MKKWTIVFLFFFIPTTGFTHSGGLNSEGCHNNKKTGDYHCHRTKSTQSSNISKSQSAVTSYNGKSAYYANCRMAREAGAAPLKIGDAGYSTFLDRDGDGIACE